MAYFDSEKNKALWAKRLAVLEQERDRRKAEGYRPTERRQAATAGAPQRAGTRVITFDQLVAKEAARHRGAANAEAQAASAGRQRSRQAASTRQAQASKAM